LSAFQQEQVGVDVQAGLHLADEPGPRLIYSALRALSDPNDYLAIRAILGLKRGVGVGTCVGIAKECMDHHLNFVQQVRGGRAPGTFSTRQAKALDAVVDVLSAMVGWTGADLLGARSRELSHIAHSHLDSVLASAWDRLALLLPDDMTLSEVEAVLGARTPREAREQLEQVYARLALPLPPDLNPVGRVRVMTLHSCKGLTAKAVFIPGLEEDLLPGPRRAPYPAQVDEAARILYVGLTRARVLCVCSFATRRTMNGTSVQHAPSRFLAALGFPFVSSSGLSVSQVASVLKDIGDL
jgi:superfamily I DNA/RNA helicase